MLGRTKRSVSGLKVLTVWVVGNLASINECLVLLASGVGGGEELLQKVWHGCHSSSDSKVVTKQRSGTGSHEAKHKDVQSRLGIVIRGPASRFRDHIPSSLRKPQSASVERHVIRLEMRPNRTETAVSASRKTHHLVWLSLA